MAIENTVVLKIFGGVGAIGTAGGIGAYGYNKGWFNYNSDVFLVVKATAAKSGTGTESLFTNEVKNYQCKFAEKTTDNSSKHKLEKDCEVLDIGDSNKFFNSTSKKINFDEILNSNTKTTSVITNSHYYKIKIKSSLLSSIKTDSASSIDLIKTDDTNAVATNKFGTLKTLFWIDSSNSPMALTQFLLVKGKDIGVTGKSSSKNASKCSFADNKPHACEIWKYSTAPVVVDRKITDPKFDSLTKNNTDTSNISAIVKDSYYVIQFTQQLNFDLNDSNLNKDITHTEWNSAGTSKESDKLVQTFTLVNKLVGEWGTDSLTALHLAK